MIIVILLIVFHPITNCAQIRTYKKYNCLTLKLYLLFFYIYKFKLRCFCFFDTNFHETFPNTTFVILEPLKTCPFWGQYIYIYIYIGYLYICLYRIFIYLFILGKGNGSFNNNIM